LVFNTINNLTTQDAQVACFENAAAHLEPSGCLVIEVGIPPRETLRVFDLSDTHVGVDEYDADTQRLVSHHFTLFDGRWERLSPLQLVLMGTAMEAAVFLFEVPTGVVADTYSRRLSLIIGFLGMGLAWMLVGVFSSAWVIIALWAFWGFSYTFTSGAYQAWITD